MGLRIAKKLYDELKTKINDLRNGNTNTNDNQNDKKVKLFGKEIVGPLDRGFKRMQYLHNQKNELCEITKYMPSEIECRKNLIQIQLLEQQINDIQTQLSQEEQK